MVTMKAIGVLGLQGSFAEHLAMLGRIGGVTPVKVKTPADLGRVDGLILPGGESTTMGRLLREFHLLEPLKKRIKEGMPVWGTCAGMILLAKEIEGGEPAHLGVMDITVRRNAYGGQLESFSGLISIGEVAGRPLTAVFIRAPWIEATGDGVKRLAEKDGRIIAARQRNMLATSFHPELTGDTAFHEYFAGMI
jgi:5'-phosphate synthase pdxT subunit